MCWSATSASLYLTLTDQLMQIYNKATDAGLYNIIDQLMPIYNWCKTVFNNNRPNYAGLYNITCQLVLAFVI